MKLNTLMFASFLVGCKSLQNQGLNVQSLRNRGASNKPLFGFLTKEPRGSVFPFNSFFEASSKSSVEDLFDAWNDRDYDRVTSFFADDAQYQVATFAGPFVGKDDISRHLQLVGTVSDEKFVVDETADAGEKIAVLYHVEQNGKTVDFSRRIAFFTVDAETGLFTTVFETVEPASKTGAADLAVLSVVSKILSAVGSNEQADGGQIDIPTNTAANSGIFDNLFASTPNPTTPPPMKYFDAWNRRDMDAAAAVFDDDVRYEDTVFPDVFEGKNALKKHLELCKDSLPSTFSFVIDDIADAGDKLGVKWHVENQGEQMPFTQGLSFYTADQKSGLIRTGIDEVEPAVWKLGAPKLLFETLVKNTGDEPIRWAPLLSWVAYMYIVFFSDGILPGANALQLEQRTWEEVRDLSLNFFFVSPLLNLPFSPVVHPILEGVFNLLLSWAALFAGFFSDERKDKPNLFPVIPAVIGMQFLTSAFLLPYLTLRSPETISVPVLKGQLSKPAQVVENRLIGLFLGSVGTGALFWGALARMDDFGGWDQRVASFWNLMSIDRVGSSFLVDLAIFAIFQGWLIDDDLRRRGVADDELTVLRNAAKFVPFFGLAAYMCLRPGYEDN